MTVKELRSIKAEPDTSSGTSTVIALRLTAADARKFSTLTEDSVGKQVAMRVADQVLAAPTVNSAITGGTVQIASDFTEQQAQDLVGEITG